MLSGIAGIVTTILAALVMWLATEVEATGKAVVELRADVRHLTKTSDQHADRLDRLERPRSPPRYNRTQSHGR